MNIYIDIILSGKNFDPEYYIKKYGVYFRNYNKRGDFNKRLKREELEGYGILTNNDDDTSENVITKVISSYEKIYKEVNDEIDFREVNLYFETLQNSFSVDLKYFCLLSQYFEKINITYLDENQN